jgi:subtilisin-like proprotein convertase family protein
MHIAKIALCMACLGLPGVALAGVAGFCSTGPITINDDGIASPYPSAAAVTGAPGSISGMTVTLNGFTHAFPDDVGIVLVSPLGQGLLLQAGAGDAAPVNSVTYSFDDSGATVLPDLTAWGGGVYKPTNYYPPDNFPAPGPGTSYADPGPANAATATFSSIYGGTQSNGTWNLYVVDFAEGDAGQIASWCIRFTGTPVSLQHFSVD